MEKQGEGKNMQVLCRTYGILGHWPASVPNTLLDTGADGSTEADDLESANINGNNNCSSHISTRFTYCGVSVT